MLSLFTHAQKASSLFVLLLFSAQAYAVPKVCDLNQKIDSIRQAQLRVKSVAEIDAFAEQLAIECEMQTRYEALKAKAGKAGISIEQLSEYKGLRFIFRYEYEWARTADVPVPYIYQLVREPKNARIPTEDRTREVWDFWLKGMSSMDEAKKKLENGYLSMDMVKKVHASFYEENKKLGPNEYDPQPGKFKFCRECSHEDHPWWKFGSEEEAKKITRAVNAVNTELEAMGYIPETKLVDSDGKLLNWVLKTDGETIYSVDPRLVGHHMSKWVFAFNSYYPVIRSEFRYQLRANEKFMTPLQFASMMQQWLVMIHPFHDGNGRNSRFWHDLVMKMSGLPYAPAGLLYQDMEYSFDEYADLVTSETQGMLDRIELCLNEPAFVDATLSFEERNKELPYDCRVLQ